jgi:TubC N-terminal docking domain
MTIEELLDRLSKEKVTLFLDGDRLRFRAVTCVLTNEHREAIAEHRDEIIKRLTAERRRSTGSCNGFCDMRNWVDDISNRGAIRTTCGVCGRFIGYRPEHVA